MNVFLECFLTPVGWVFPSRCYLFSLRAVLVIAVGKCFLCKISSISVYILHMYFQWKYFTSSFSGVYILTLCLLLFFFLINTYCLSHLIWFTCCCRICCFFRFNRFVLYLFPLYRLGKAIQLVLLLIYWSFLSHVSRWNINLLQRKGNALPTLVLYFISFGSFLVWLWPIEFTEITLLFFLKGWHNLLAILLSQLILNMLHQSLRVKLGLDMFFVNIYSSFTILGKINSWLCSILGSSLIQVSQQNQNLEY